MAKEARRDKSKKVVGRVVGIVVAIVVITGAIWLFSRGNDSATEATTTTAAVVDTTVPGETTTPIAITKPSVVVPASVPTELTVTDLKEGTGEGAKAGDSITLYYVGVLTADGSEFQNSYDSAQPFTFTLGQGEVIAGWDQGMVGVKVGGQRQLDIPAELAYGDAERSGIPANSALTFVVDILAITPAG